MNCAALYPVRCCKLGVTRDPHYHGTADWFFLIFLKSPSTPVVGGDVASIFLLPPVSAAVLSPQCRVFVNRCWCQQKPTESASYSHSSRMVACIACQNLHMLQSRVSALPACCNGNHRRHAPSHSSFIPQNFNRHPVSLFLVSPPAL
jgi:hypothetical protein